MPSQGTATAPARQRHTSSGPLVGLGTARTAASSLRGSSAEHRPQSRDGRLLPVARRVVRECWRRRSGHHGRDGVALDAEARSGSDEPSRSSSAGSASSEPSSRVEQQRCCPRRRSCRSVEQDARGLDLDAKPALASNNASSCRAIAGVPSESMCARVARDRRWPPSPDSGSARGSTGAAGRLHAHSELDQDLDGLLGVEARKLDQMVRGGSATTPPAIARTRRRRLDVGDRRVESDRRLSSSTASRHPTATSASAGQPRCTPGGRAASARPVRSTSHVGHARPSEPSCRVSAVASWIGRAVPP